MSLATFLQQIRTGFGLSKKDEEEKKKSMIFGLDAGIKPEEKKYYEEKGKPIGLAAVKETVKEPTITRAKTGGLTSWLTPSTSQSRGLAAVPQPEQKMTLGKSEGAFREWYARKSKQWNLDPNPDDPRHFYDYRAAYLAGAEPDENGHWPSRFKKEGHPNQYVNGIDTITGEQRTAKKMTFEAGEGLPESMVPEAQRTLAKKDVWPAPKIIPTLGKSVASSFITALQGKEGASAISKDRGDKFVASTQEDIQRLAETRPRVAELVSSLGFSIVGMGAGAATGVPLAALPVPGARPLAYITGGAVSGKAAFNMATYQIMQSYLELRNEEVKAATGKEMTSEQEKRFKTQFDSLATQYGLWEAVPEAISNVAGFGILAAPLTRIFGKSLAVRILGKLGAYYGEELLTETITQMGQKHIEAQANFPNAEDIDWRDPADWAESLKEVAPNTIILSTVMGGTVNIGMKLQALNQEVSKDNPLYEKMRSKIIELHEEGVPVGLSIKDISKVEGATEELGLKAVEEEKPTKSLSDLLAKEAVKYKSAEEFIESFGYGKGGLGAGVEYTPLKRILLEPGQISLADILGKDKEINVYRGVDRAIQKEIVSGDYVATSKTLAATYARPENVISKKVHLKDVYVDRDDGITAKDIQEWIGGEETHLEANYISSPVTKSQLTDIYNQATQQQKTEGGMLTPEQVKRADRLPFMPSKVTTSEAKAKIAVQKKQLNTIPQNILKKVEKRRQMINEYVEGKSGWRIQAEVESRLSQLENKDNDIISGIKNNSYFKKEKTIKDAMGDGWLMRKGNRNVIVESKDVEHYMLEKGYDKVIEIDSLADEAGFDNGQDFLDYQLKLSKISTKKSIRRLAEKELLSKDTLFQKLNKDIEETKKQMGTRAFKKTLESQTTQRLAFRRNKVKMLRDFFKLSDEDLKKISRKDPRWMDDYEFEKFMDGMEIKAVELQRTREAKAEVMDMIERKEYKQWEELREYMKFPQVEDMTLKQLHDFAEVLSKYQDRDVFLSLAKLEVIDQTDLAGARTYREAKMKLVEEANKRGMTVNFGQVDRIKVRKFMDRLLGDTTLAKRNALYRLMVDLTNKAFLNAEVKALEMEKQINEYGTKSRKSRKVKGLKERLWEWAVPQDKAVFNYLDQGPKTKNKLTQHMTTEELDFANFLGVHFRRAYRWMVQSKAMKTGRENYMTHIRRHWLEIIKDVRKGEWPDRTKPGDAITYHGPLGAIYRIGRRLSKTSIGQAIGEMMEQEKMDEQVMDILNEKTGEVLPYNKFIKYAQHRTGGLIPSQDVVKTSKIYFRTLYRAQALTSVMAKLMIYVEALTPYKQTPKGLDFDPTLKEFYKAWMNNKKGRVESRWIPQGSKLDTVLQALQSFVSIKDLGFNLPVQIATSIGEFVMTYPLLGKNDYARAIKRLNTKQGKRITKKYENFIGKNPWAELREPGQNIAEKSLDLLFILFRDSSVRANKLALLGQMTKGEFKTGELSADRLADIKRETGRWRTMPGSESVRGATPEARIAKQYKSWALPAISTMTQDLSKLIKDAATKKPKEALTTREARELYRVAEITVAALVITSLIADDEDDPTFIGQLKRKVCREALTLMGALDVNWLAAAPRLVTWGRNIIKSLGQIIMLEKYKTRPGLKGVEGLKKELIPRAIKQFIPERTTKKSSVDEWEKIFGSGAGSGAVDWDKVFGSGGGAVDWDAVFK